MVTCSALSTPIAVTTVIRLCSLGAPHSAERHVHHEARPQQPRARPGWRRAPLRGPPAPRPIDQFSARSSALVQRQLANHTQNAFPPALFFGMEIGRMHAGEEWQLKDTQRERTKHVRGHCSIERVRRDLWSCLKADVSGLGQEHSSQAVEFGEQQPFSGGRSCTGPDSHCTHYDDNLFSTLHFWCLNLSRRSFAALFFILYRFFV